MQACLFVCVCLDLLGVRDLTHRADKEKMCDQVDPVGEGRLTSQWPLSGGGKMSAERKGIPSAARPNQPTGLIEIYSLIEP